MYQPVASHRRRDAALATALSKLGGDAAAARLLGITKQAIYFWQRCPAKWVLVLESMTGVSRHDLRPDIYPRDEARFVRAMACASNSPRLSEDVK